MQISLPFLRALTILGLVRNSIEVPMPRPPHRTPQKVNGNPVIISVLSRKKNGLIRHGGSLYSKLGFIMKESMILIFDKGNYYIF